MSASGVVAAGRAAGAESTVHANPTASTRLNLRVMRPSPGPELRRSPYRSTTSSEGSPRRLERRRGRHETGARVEYDENRPGEVAPPEQLHADAGRENQSQAVRPRELQGDGARTRAEGPEQKARGHDSSPARVRRFRSRQGPA